MDGDATATDWPPTRRAIVAGFGPVGRVVATGLEKAGFELTLVELNPQTIERQTEAGRAVVPGDITEPDTLRRAGVADADALILTIPDEDQVIRACRAARSLAPDVFISVRTNFLSKGMLARQAGADNVTVEEVVTAEAMQHAVLDGLSVNPSRER